jgi:thioredoxin 1
MSDLKELDVAGFNELIDTAERPVLVDFYATWCGPCKMMAPVLEAMAAKHAGRVEFAQVDVGQHAELAARFRVQAVPTLMLFKQGEVVDVKMGLVGPPELEKMLDEHAPRRAKAN